MASRIKLSSPLDSCEDGHCGPSIEETTVHVTDVFEYAEFVCKVSPIIRTNKLYLQDYGWSGGTLALTFRSMEDGTKFKLFYDGECI